MASDVNTDSPVAKELKPDARGKPAGGGEFMHPTKDLSSATKVLRSSQKKVSHCTTSEEEEWSKTYAKAASVH
ncbi:hypothetical protein KFL_002680210 [Klebsormidium nitens]|uniref:Uncharacterized protein n=1 Tax=Klebsormidium nitens TaxID=105231 RepID=A0A1Y1I548_KLENI|nr:hypothetical protein KFL_002680210 [Klebsormidium nitens]|eukprot:GAQ86075.1 hypothetical protein KFL_002680210 [Klebsormidium nitens]